MEKEIVQIQKQLDKIMDNELVHLKADISDLSKRISDQNAELTNRISDQAIDTSEIKTNISWLMRYHWTTMTAAAGAFIASVIGIILK